MNLGNVDDDQEGTQPNLTPLIDVVFQLLIFFVITMTYATQSELMLPIELAEAVAGSPDEDNDFRGTTITVTADGQAVVDGDQPVDADELRAHLQALQAGNPGARVIVRGDENVAHGRMVAILDLVTQVGFSRVDLIVTTPS